MSLNQTLTTIKHNVISLLEHAHKSHSHWLMNTIICIHPIILSMSPFSSNETMKTIATKQDHHFCFFFPLLHNKKQEMAEEQTNELDQLRSSTLIDNELVKQDAKERTQRRTAKHLTTRKWIGDFPNNVWAVDLIDFHNDKTINRHFSYILVAVDVYSRYAFAVPMKSKNTAAIKHALQETFNQAKQVINHPASQPKPNRIASDEEMGLKALDTWLETNNIIHYIAQGKYGAAIAESFIKTFKEDLAYYVTKEKRNYWINHYQKVLDDYNHRIHTALSNKDQEGHLIKQTPLTYTLHKPTTTRMMNHTKSNQKIRKKSFMKETSFDSSTTNH